MSADPFAPESFETFMPLFPPRRRRPPRSGWVSGVIFGVMFGLWAFPAVRYTLGAQLAFAFAEDSIPWMRALDTRRNAKELPRLEHTAASAPGDYLLQIGRATARADESLREPELPTGQETPDDKTLVRLGLVARDFPMVPGAYAHFARYMMAARIRVQRAEIDPRLVPVPTPPDTSPPEKMIAPGRNSGLLPLSGNTPRARRRDVQLMEWALHSGELRDPDNAFWPAMLAATYFSAQRDTEALAALQRASRKSQWNAYIHEEVLGQWRLYSAAYGDNGAAQKIAPLSLIAFPHLLEIRHAAEMARWHAEWEADHHHPEKAIAIRRSVIWLGIRMRETAQWSLEALCGTNLLLIAASDSGGTPAAIRNVHAWELQAPRYLELLRQANMGHELSWLYAEVENSCALRERVGIARYDASYPGIPPGIPLMALFGDWIIGTCLIQQALSLSLAVLAVVLLRRFKRDRPALFRPVCIVAWLVVFGGTAACGALLMLGVPSTRGAMGFVIGVTLLLALGFQQLGRLLARRRALRVAWLDMEPDALAETAWRPSTTFRMLALLLGSGAALLYYLRPELSFLHPVATLLMSIMGGSRTPSARDALGLAFMACGLPVAFILLACVWGIRRRVPPLTSVQVGLRRSLLPALACLSVLYLALLDRTLRLDAAASRGISEVAQNDLQWVLTHSPAPPPETDSTDAGS